MIPGGKIEEILNYVNYDREDLVEIMRRRLDTALQNGRITLLGARKLLKNYIRSLT